MDKPSVYYHGLELTTTDNYLHLMSISVTTYDERDVYACSAKGLTAAVKACTPLMWMNTWTTRTSHHTSLYHLLRHQTFKECTQSYKPSNLYSSRLWNRVTWLVGIDIFHLTSLEGLWHRPTMLFQTIH